MPSWVTPDVGIADWEEGCRLARFHKGAVKEGLDPHAFSVVICVGQQPNPDAQFLYPFHHPPFPEHQVRDVAIIVDRLLQEGWKVVLHCVEGRERSPLLAAYFLTTRGLSWDEAYAKVKEARPQVEDRRSWVR